MAQNGQLGENSSMINSTDCDPHSARIGQTDQKMLEHGQDKLDEQDMTEHNSPLRNTTFEQSAQMQGIDTNDTQLSYKKTTVIPMPYAQQARQKAKSLARGNLSNQRGRNYNLMRESFDIKDLRKQGIEGFDGGILSPLSGSKVN